ncbi:response regulator [Oligoflexaceae bacterium]|nr:response regulator [Oligoflexaceae bacterium]
MNNLNVILEPEVKQSFYKDRTSSFRDMISLSKVQHPTVAPKILLVDDDPIFGKIMTRVADQNNSQMTVCSSLAEVAMLDSFDFEVAIIDYDLGNVTGYYLASHLDKLTSREIPVVLVSQSQRDDVDRWPTSIREFVNKKIGPYAILDAAFEAHEVKRIHDKIRRPENA